MITAVGIMYMATYHTGNATNLLLLLLNPDYFGASEPFLFSDF
jgi:hypothetical protein